jgi:hypothetical protein
MSAASPKAFSDQRNGKIEQMRTTAFARLQSDVNAQLSLV